MSSFLEKMATQASRAKQYTEEKLGHAEKTELDVELQTMINRAEQMKGYTEKIKDGTEAVVQPNPKVRAEEYVFGKLDIARMNERITNEEDLGQKMIDAGNQLGPRTTYGASLIKAGETFIKLGNANKQYSQNAAVKYLQPLHNFLDGDVSAMGKAKQELEFKRLDLDSAKNKLKKLKDKGKPENDPDIVKAEKDLQTAQEAFDKQINVLRPMLDDIIRSQDYHATLLSSFIDTMKEYHDTCQEHTRQLQSELKKYDDNFCQLLNVQKTLRQSFRTKSLITSVHQETSVYLTKSSILPQKQAMSLMAHFISICLLLFVV